MVTPQADRLFLCTLGNLFAQQENQKDYQVGGMPEKAEPAFDFQPEQERERQKHPDTYR